MYRQDDDDKKKKKEKVRRTAANDTEGEDRDTVRHVGPGRLFAEIVPANARVTVYNE